MTCSYLANGAPNRTLATVLADFSSLVSATPLCEDRLVPRSASPDENCDVRFIPEDAIATTAVPPSSNRDYGSPKSDCAGSASFAHGRRRCRDCPRFWRSALSYRRRGSGAQLRGGRKAVVARGAGRAAPVGHRQPPAVPLDVSQRPGNALGIQRRRPYARLGQRRPLALGRGHRPAHHSDGAAVVGDGGRLRI